MLLEEGAGYSAEVEHRPGGAYADLGPYYQKDREVTMLLLIILLILLFGGGGGYYGYSRWGAPGGLGIVLVILLVLLLAGSFGGLRFR